MIDTVVLMLTSDTYVITDPDNFNPSARWIESPWLKSKGIRSKQNAPAKELRQGIYKPCLTLSYCKSSNGYRDIMLKIEFSLPKLVFGNNFQELQYKDFGKIIKLLSENLKAMGVEVGNEALIYAPVSAIHYSKNIILKDGSTPYHFIQKIKESNVPLFLDSNERDYRNEGHKLQMALQFV